jgi:IS605 OrfB family transposase
VSGWREEWDCARDRIEAKGSSDEPFGNLTITVTADGEVSLRLPKPLEHLANAPRGRYILSGRAVFAYRGDEWRARITDGQSLSYAITRRPGRAGRYLTAAWACPPTTSDVICAHDPRGDVRADGPVVGVDLNDGHLALRRLDGHGNPVGRPERIDIDLTGSSARRDAQVRHAITRLIHYTRRHGCDTIAVEDLDFADARAIGRETMGRGTRGKRFRKSVAGIPTAVFRNRLTGQAQRNGVRVFAVNPAYSSVWGDQHWRTPYENVTRHGAAATVIGRPAQGFQARRREGVTRTRPEDRVVRAASSVPGTPRRRENGFGLPADVEVILGPVSPRESLAPGPDLEGSRIVASSTPVRISVPLTEAPGQPAVRVCRLTWRAKRNEAKAGASGGGDSRRRA